jgi:hypothetical protein
MVTGVSDHPITTDVLSLQASVLDHASEFVELVYQQAPREYEGLLASGRFHDELARVSVFNHGKLFAYAEFSVFRREFLRRFPDAAAPACINAFSSLFLKNDISITNLVAFVEGSDDRRQLLLNQPPGDSGHN